MPRFPDNIGIALVCPACRSPAVRNGERFVCRGRDCRRAYAIDDGIPRFLVAEATILDDAAWREAVGAG